MADGAGAPKESATGERVISPSQLQRPTMIRSATACLRIRPTRNGGAREGFMPVSEREIRIASNASSQEIGAALMRGFAWCADFD